MADSDQPSQAAELSGSLTRNIDILAELRRRHVASAGVPERVAVRITGFIGSM